MQSNQKVSPNPDIESTIINSALWAAAGDALGWITELSGGEGGVIRRTGDSKVVQTVSWERIIGGKSGVKVKLPAGTYSDDTQLRLAVSRSIQPTGFFDVESFAKIELTVWLNYALGGGIGTKAAAQNLTKRSVNWFSNFFVNEKQNYFRSGGNGAAMRIQPHVWCTFNSQYNDDFILNVLKDSLVTHGHPHGFCGAVFHALMLQDTIKTRKIPAPHDWHKYLDVIKNLNEVIESDSQLKTFWLSSWERENDKSLKRGLQEFVDEVSKDVEIIINHLGEINPNFHEILYSLGCLTKKYKGSGIKTALASGVLAYLFQNRDIKEALICAANELDSDTDTIATMCGSLLGSLSSTLPNWDIQDSFYIINEVKRLVSTSSQIQTSQDFIYPEISLWVPPSSQINTVGKHGGDLHIAGLGKLKALNDVSYSNGNALWKWYSLPFGQTILAKCRKTDLKNLHFNQISLNKNKINADVAYIEKTKEKYQRLQNQNEVEITQELELDLFNPSQVSKDTSHTDNKSDENKYNSSSKLEQVKDFLDYVTDEVINSNFDNYVIGKMLNECIDRTQSIQSVVSFAGIIAKAKIVRQRKNK